MPASSAADATAVRTMEVASMLSPCLKLGWPAEAPASSEVFDVAVDADRLAGQVACARRAQEQRQRSDIVGADHAAQRDAIQVLLAHRVDVDAHRLRARGDHGAHAL